MGYCPELQGPAHGWPATASGWQWNPCRWTLIHELPVLMGFPQSYAQIVRIAGLRYVVIGPQRDGLGDDLHILESAEHGDAHGGMVVSQGLEDHLPHGLSPELFLYVA